MASRKEELDELESNEGEEEKYESDFIEDDSEEEEDSDATYKYDTEAGEEEEEEVEDFLEEEEEKSSSSPFQETFERSSLVDIDPSNIVNGKRIRKKTKHYAQEVYSSEEYLRMILVDVPEDERRAACEDEDLEEDYIYSDEEDPYGDDNAENKQLSSRSPVVPPGSSSMGDQKNKTSETEVAVKKATEEAKSLSSRKPTPYPPAKKAEKEKSLPDPKTEKQELEKRKPTSDLPPPKKRGISVS